MKLLLILSTYSLFAYELECIKTNSGLVRCENKEVICYLIPSAGLQCKFK